MEYSGNAIERYRRGAALHQALAHPVRLRILHILARSEACVCHLTAALGMRQPYVSQQLAALRDAGLVVGRREGTLIYYRLCDARLAAVLALGEDLVAQATDDEAAEEQAAEEQAAEGTVAGCPCPRCLSAIEGRIAAPLPAGSDAAPGLTMTSAAGTASASRVGATRQRRT